KWATHLIPHLSNKYSTTGVHAVSLDTSYSYDYLASTTGAGTAPPMPVFVVAKVKIATGVRGVQGRTGISGLGNNAVQATNPNFLDAGTQAEFQTAWAAFVTAVQADPTVDATLAVLSRRHLNAPRPVPLVVEATSSQVVAQLGTRRTRL